MTDASTSGPELIEAIVGAQADLAAASTQLNFRANDVFKATSGFIGELVGSLLGATVLAQPERTEKLGASGVAKLKGRLAEWQAQVPVASAKHLRGAFAWTFPQAPQDIGDTDLAPLFLGNGELPWMMTDAIRVLAAGAGELARSGGYEVSPSSSWDVAGDGTVRRYLGQFEVAPRVTIALRSYSDARLRYFRRLRKLRRLESRRDTLDARLEADADRESTIGAARWLWSGSADTPAG